MSTNVLPVDRTDIFQLDVSIHTPWRRGLFNIVRKPLEKLVGMTEINAIYARSTTGGAGGNSHTFVRNVLSDLNVHCDVSDEDLARIPRGGPAVVVANHPFGGIEGMLLAELLLRVRPDVKVMANFLLNRVPELHDRFIFVDPFGKPESARANVRGLRQALDHVRSGGMLAVFPSGAVSHMDWKTRQIVDPVWSDTIARIIRRAEAVTVPVFFDGANGKLFQLAGLLHPNLRTAMLPKEVLNKRHRRFPARVGTPIPFKKLLAFENDTDLTEQLRQRTYLLKYRGLPKAQVKQSMPTELQTIVDAVPSVLLNEEINRLPDDCLLAENADLQVYHATADQIPFTLREIGRLREITFRQTGEGTGLSIDLDQFDRHYLHLFLWNKQKCEVVGGYRLGLSDKILASQGAGGLYTTTLFHFNPAIFRKLNPAIELGRSFVRVEYQRAFAPLLMIWKGIGTFVSRNPQYHILFGPVSISNTYSSVSRQLMVAFLKLHSHLPDLSSLVKARIPFCLQSLFSSPVANAHVAAGDVDGVSDFISEIESDHKGLPILIKHYLKLGGRMLEFNQDPKFSDVVDALIYVDLRKTDRRALERYMGKPEAAAFFEHHAGTHA